MYGDLVNGMCYTAFLPVYLWLWIKDPSPGARNIVIAFAWTTICCWFSFLKGNAFASLLACVGMTLSIAGMNLYRWPHADEVVVFPQFLWSLLIISGNLSLTFTQKTAMTLIALVNALAVAFYSPLLEVTDALPLLLGATSVHLLFHYLGAKSGKSKVIRAHSASLILAGTFAYHMSAEMMTIVSSPGYAAEGGYSILKAGFFASVGLVAALAFRREIYDNDALERLLKERAKEISKQAEKLRVVGLALEASETAIAITDSNQQIIWSNPALARLTGMQQSQLNSKSIQSVLSSSRNLCKFFNDNFSSHVEIMVKGRDIDVEVSPFPGEDGEKNDGSRFLVVLTDITEQRARERAEKSAESEALQAEAMSEAMVTLSHELRTPLQGIMGMTSLLLEDTYFSSDAKESLLVVMTSSRLLLTLINNLLDIRKCDADMMDAFQLKEMAISNALADATAFCKPFASISGVDLQVVDLGRTRNVDVESNSLRFQQIMVNLISNAIKYTSTGSTVSVRAEVMTLEKVDAIILGSLASGPHQPAWDGYSPGQMNVAVISVSDTGSGVSTEEAGSLFGRFSQLTNAPTHHIEGDSHSLAQPSGTGLGLNLCLKFVTRMKGNIWVNNNPTGGSCFSFYLRLVDGSNFVSCPPLPNSVSIPKRVSSPPPASAEKYRVLVVDDTIINLKVLDQMLKRIGVGRVTIASSGASALEALKDGDYNLVLTDIQMPQMSGTELSDTIRRSPHASDLVIVGITAELTDSIYEKCTDSGMSHVLSKPITYKNLQDFFDATLQTLPLLGSKDLSTLRLFLESQQQ